MLLADIRFCTEEDLGQILTVDQTSPHPWPERVIARDFREGGARLSYLGAFAPVERGKLLGYAVLGDEREHGLLMNLVVLPAYRRLGIGIQLVVAAAECAAELGFPSLALRVRLSNLAALALYRSLGFRADATRESFYSDGDIAQYMSAALPLNISPKGEE